MPPHEAYLARLRFGPPRYRREGLLPGIAGPGLDGGEVQHHVDIFTNHGTGVEAVADVVEAVLQAAGFGTERMDKTAGLADLFEGMGEGLAEWIVTAPAGEKMALQMAYFDRSREPVIMEIGPVLDLEDVAGGKVCGWPAGSSRVITPTPWRCWTTTAPSSSSASPEGWIRAWPAGTSPTRPGSSTRSMMRHSPATG
jgi:hypothetical protein